MEVLSRAGGELGHLYHLHSHPRREPEDPERSTRGLCHVVSLCVFRQTTEEGAEGLKRL